MAKEQQSVADIFRRAQAIFRENRGMSLKDLKARLLDEYAGAPIPPVYNLTIPEQDAQAPEEDWTAGLSVVLRGIQREDWSEIITGIVLSLELTERYVREHGPVGIDRDWHDRNVGIKGAVDKGVGKWMPQELMNLAEQAGRKKREDGGQR